LLGAQPMKARIAFALACSVACSAALADLSDVANLDSGLPTEIEDAQPIDHGEKEVQLITRWDRQRNGANLYVAEPQFQWGFAPRWQAALTLHALGGTADTTTSGDVRLQLMRQLNEEANGLPALAAFVRFDAPTGQDSRGLDTTLRLAATKTLGAERYTHQVQANLMWTHNAAPGADERSHFARVLVGYSTALNERTVVVADLIREQERTRGEMASIAELGVRRALAGKTVLSLGLAAGTGGADAPRWRLMAGLERSF
jgi:hypothetical protein